jgi:hypothetical protein
MTAKTIKLSAKDQISTIRTGNGSITIELGK